MLIRTILGILLALASCAFAQDPGPGRGRMGHFPPEMAGPPPGARLLGGVAGIPARVVRNAPYSAEAVTEVTQALADGNHIRQTSAARVFRDSDGRVRNEQSLSGLGVLGLNASLPRVVFINDPVAGVNYAINQQDHTATKTEWVRRGGPRDGGQQYGEGRARGPRPEDGGRPNGPRRGRGDMAARRPSMENIKTESLGRQTIEGVPADGTRSVQTIPAGQMGNEQPIQIVSEQWYSPDLQTVVLWKHSDPRTGETVFRLTNISRDEPAPSLFQLPVDCRIVEPRVPRPR